MRMRLFLGLLILGALGLTSSAEAQVYARPLDTHGANCFLHNNYAYLPLRTVTDFLGASVTLAGNGVSISLDGNTLALVSGSTRAFFNGSPVVLPVPPLEVNGVTMVPVTLFHDYFFADIDWQPSLNRVFIYGPEGWGYCDVLPEPTPYATSVIRSFGGPVLNPSPFFFDGVPFVPLLDWDDFFGLPVFFEPDFDDFIVVARGRELIFVIGSPFVFFGRERFLLPAAPIIVGRRVFVPLSFFSLPPIGAPVEVVGNVIRARGPMGMRQVRIASRPPGRIVTTTPAQPRQLGIPMRPAVIPGVVTPTPRPPMQALHPPRVAPRAVRPAPPMAAVTPPRVRPTRPPVTAVRPAPVAPAPPAMAARPLPQARPTVPALRPGMPPQAMRQGGRLAAAPPARSMPQVRQRPAPPAAPQAARPAPGGPPRTEQRAAPQAGAERGQGQGRG